jgi:hypothetical protein
MRHVWLGKSLLFPVVALLSVNCGKPLVVQAPSGVSAARPAVKSSIGKPEVVLGQEVVLRGKVNNAEKIEINRGGDAISPIGTLVVRPGALTSYLLTARRKKTLSAARDNGQRHFAAFNFSEWSKSIDFRPRAYPATGVGRRLLCLRSGAGRLQAGIRRAQKRASNVGSRTEGCISFLRNEQLVILAVNIL